MYPKHENADTIAKYLLRIKIKLNKSLCMQSLYAIKTINKLENVWHKTPKHTPSFRQEQGVILPFDWVHSAKSAKIGGIESRWNRLP